MVNVGLMLFIHLNMGLQELASAAVLRVYRGQDPTRQGGNKLWCGGSRLATPPKQDWQEHAGTPGLLWQQMLGLHPGLRPAALDSMESLALPWLPFKVC